MSTNEPTQQTKEKKRPLAADFQDRLMMLKLNLDKARLNHERYTGHYFVPLGEVERILSKRAIHSLFRSWEPGLEEERMKRATDVLLQRQPKEGLGEYRFLRVFATLIYLAKEIYIEKAIVHFLYPERSDWQPPEDNSRPSNGETARKVFYNKDGYDKSFYKEFFEKKEHFCALVLSEGERHEACESQFLPFFFGKNLGKGSAGTVYQVKVAKHHWVDKWLSNPEEIILAIKEFHTSGNNNSNDSFKNEFENLMKLKNASIKSESVMLPLASLIHGMNRYLIYEFAETDLNKYLHIQKEPDEKYFFNSTKTKDVLKNATDLVGALHWIHQYTPHRQIWHGDIRPDNILIINKNSRELWKLADFDRSHEETTSLISGSSETHVMNSHTYRAPDVEDKKWGRRSDVWSMACIVSLILSWLHNGPESVNAFAEKRRNGDPESPDHFYVLGTANRHKNEKVLSPQVREWLEFLREKASEKAVLEKEQIDLSWYSKYVNNVIKHLQEQLFIHRDAPREYADAFYAFMDKEYSSIPQDEYPIIKPEPSKESARSSVRYSDSFITHSGTSTQSSSGATTPTRLARIFMNQSGTGKTTRLQSSSNLRHTYTAIGHHSNIIPPEIATSPPSSNPPANDPAPANSFRSGKCLPLCSAIKAHSYGDIQRCNEYELNEICFACGDRPIHKAIREGSEAMLKCLLKTEKIDLESKNNRDGGGLTPAMLSCKEDKLWATKLLYNEGAILDIKSNEYQNMELPSRIKKDIKAHIKERKKDGKKKKV